MLIISPDIIVAFVRTFTFEWNDLWFRYFRVGSRIL